MNIEKFLKIKNIFYENVNSLFLNNINLLNKYHYNKCKIYKKIINGFSFDIKKNNKLENLPYLTTSIFKHFDIHSLSKKKIFKVLTSSGTSNQIPSKIYLDKKSTINQTFVLKKTFHDFFNDSERYPMLVIDRPLSLNSKNTYSARTAAILGFSIFGRNIVYALNNDLTLNKKVVENFFKKNKKKNYIFGFTSLLWFNFINQLVKDKNYIDMSNSSIIHGGGWKKLEKQKVSNSLFKKYIKKKFKIKKIHNYYGMIEQIGSVFFECEKGFFHTSVLNDIIVRKNDGKVLENKKSGIIQLLSILPTSYPGHNILTEDVGSIIGENNCICGRKGKYFKVYGRVEKAEVRGCSNVIHN